MTLREGVTVTVERDTVTATATAAVPGVAFDLRRRPADHLIALAEWQG